MQSTTSLPDARGPCATAVSWSNGMSGGGGPRQPPSRQSAIITPKRVVRASRTGGPRPSSPGTVAWLWRVPEEGPRAAGECGKRPRDPRRAGGLRHVAAHARHVTTPLWPGGYTPNSQALTPAALRLPVAARSPCLHRIVCSRSPVSVFCSRVRSPGFAGCVSGRFVRESGGRGGSGQLDDACVWYIV